MNAKHLYFLLIFIAVTACKKQAKTKGLITKNAMVVSAREEASTIGANILKQGGNAFDAMVATELALAVAYPYAGNLGGGGFMVYRQHNGAIGALDYREKAPLAAYKDMYLHEDGSIVKNKSTLGAMAIGVPGTVAGVFATHKKFGSLPIEALIQPAIDLATKGVIVTKKQEQRLQKFQELFLQVNKDSILFNNDWKENDTIKYPKLAATLTTLKNQGEAAFYKGAIAAKLADFIQANGGVITKEDFAAYKAVWRTPISFNYDDLRVISMSPPSSGGICLAQIMLAIESYNLHEYQHNTAKTIQVITEASRRAYADRSFFLGDPDFVTIPVDTLLDKTYIHKRMDDFSFDKATPSSSIAHGDISFTESDETTHYSIIDAYGNAVSVTTTLNGAYGSKLYASELGFFLNNEMDDFSSKPGTPNMFGLIGAKANEIAPEKRMLSSMSPTIVEKEGKLWMVVGTPGGSTIITSVLQTILNVHEFNFGMQEAVNQPRFHHQWLPDEIKMEPNGFTDEVKQELQAKGYSINEKNSLIIGKVEGILVLPDGSLEGGADPRGDDKAVGY